MEATVWLTGFQVFGNHETNVSKDIAEQLIGQTFEVYLESKPPFGLESESINIKFEGEILTVDERGSRLTAERLESVLPDAVIHLGLKENASQVLLELCAFNQCEFRIEDNSGRRLQNTRVVKNALPLLHTTTHAPSLRLFVDEHDDIEISEDCGLFVCNETYFRTLHKIESDILTIRNRPLPALFMHLPSEEKVQRERLQSIVLDVAARIVQKPVIQVVGGAIVSDAGKILACRRSSDQEMGGFWEFPGGKIEGGESEDSALIREMQEELGISVEVIRCIGRFSHDYGSMILNLAFYSCIADGQNPVLSVHDELKWLSEDEVHTVQWLPPDVGFVEKLATGGFNKLRNIA